MILNWKAVAHPTILDGLVVRFRLKKQPWRNEPEVSASRNGVMLHGAWGAMDAAAVAEVREVLELAVRVHKTIAHEGHKINLKALVPESVEVE